MPREIIYYADNTSMGDTSADDCNAYRNWAKSQLQKEYRDCEITVSSEPCLDTIRVSDDLHHRKREIQEFAKRLWDTCPWDWQYQSSEITNEEVTEEDRMYNR